MSKVNVGRTFVNAEFDNDGRMLKSNKKTITYFDDEQGYLFRLNKEAIKVFKGCGLPRDLTESETARIYRLSLMMHKGSNLVCYRAGNVVKSMNITRMAHHLYISDRQATAFINRMIDRRIVGKVSVSVGDKTETQYYINPVYFFAGKWLNYNLYFLFKHDLDQILPKWVKDKFNQDLAQKQQVQT